MLASEAGESPADKATDDEDEDGGKLTLDMLLLLVINLLLLENPSLSTSTWVTLYTTPLDASVERLTPSSLLLPGHLSSVTLLLGFGCPGPRSLQGYYELYWNIFVGFGCWLDS